MEGNAYSTLTGYRTAIANTLKPKFGVRFCGGPRDFRPLDQFGDHETKKPYSLSKWDLSLVLYVLLGVSFELMLKSSV